MGVIYATVRVSVILPVILFYQICGGQREILSVTSLIGQVTARHYKT